jgi:hypothetical protein
MEASFKTVKPSLANSFLRLSTWFLITSLLHSCTRITLFCAEAEKIQQKLNTNRIRYGFKRRILIVLQELSIKLFKRIYVLAKDVHDLALLSNNPDISLQELSDN